MSLSPDQEKQLFLAALERPAGPEREAFLQSHCGEDAAALNTLRGLLQAHEQAGCFMQGEEASAPDSPPGNAPDILPMAEQPGTVIGRYKLLQIIGEGGFGVVYLAEQREPVRRRVAVKIIKLGMDTHQVIGRFEAERQALAMMNHPNIAKVLDGGATETGRPYFVMELVTGVSLVEFCDTNQLTISQRLNLFVKVCQAIHHAHQKGVIHRDIKPSNVLVTMQEDQPVPKVIDFGVAKATQQELTEKTIFTRHAEFIGTPAYMSPEQAQFSGLDIDTRTDIYSLGVLLYELLTGRTPLDAEELILAGYDGMRAIIREKEPPRPSAYLKSCPLEHLATTARQRHISPGRLAAAVQGDLDWIVMKALEKDRTRRYESAASLAHDIECYRTHQPIQAGPPGLAYRFGKFARRHRATLTASVAIALALLLGTITSLSLAFRALRAERAARDSLVKELDAREHAQQAAAKALAAQQRANEEAAVAAAVNRFIREEFLGQADPMNEPNRNLTLRQLLNQAAARLESHFAGPPLVEASLRHTMGQVYLNLGEFKEAQKHADRSVALRRQHLGDAHRDSLQSRTLQASVQYHLGHYVEATPVLEELWALTKETLGPEHALTLEVEYWLSLTYRQRSQTDKALALAEHVLQTSQHALQPNHWLQAAAVSSRAGFYLNRNQFQEAEAFYTEWLNRNRQNFGEEHPATLNLMHGLAYAYEWLGKLDAARDLYSKTEALKRRVLGPEHPSRLSTLEHFANFRIRRLEFTEAEAMLREVHAVRRRVLGLTHPATRDTLGSLNHFYTTAKTPNEHRAFLRQTLLEDPGHPHALDYLAQYTDPDTLLALLPHSESIPQTWQYTTNEPPNSWITPAFDDSSWPKAEASFGVSEIHPPRTPWTTPNIWLRREFHLDQVPDGRLVISILQDDNAEVFLNGKLLLSRKGWSGRRYRRVFGLPEGQATLHSGRNVLAVRCHNISLEGLIDVGLYVEPPEISVFLPEPADSAESLSAAPTP